MPSYTPLRSGMRILLTLLITLSCRISSATPSLEVALQYAGERYSSLFEIVTGGIDRGAHLSWLSQFPAEGVIGQYKFVNLRVCIDTSSYMCVCTHILIKSEPCLCVCTRARALADEHTILPLSAFEVVHQRTVSKKVLHLEAQLQKAKRVLLILLKLKECAELLPVFSTLDLLVNLFEEVDQVFALHEAAYYSIQFTLGTLRHFPTRISDSAS